MRAKEFITEDASLTTQVGYTLPQTFTIPGLVNSDAYKQYRYGLALAAGQRQKNHDDTDNMQKESEFGEQFTMIAYSQGDAQIIDAANKIIGVNPKQVGTNISQEPKEVNVKSPMTNPGPIKRRSR
mgnify:CR=1 FL=1